MPIFTVHQAKTQLSRLLARVQDGEDVVIAKGRQPVARIVRIERTEPRRPGALRGKVAVTPAFFDPLPAGDIAAWGEDA